MWQEDRVCEHLRACTHTLTHSHGGNHMWKLISLQQGCFRTQHSLRSRDKLWMWECIWLCRRESACVCVGVCMHGFKDHRITMRVCVWVCVLLQGWEKSISVMTGKWKHCSGLQLNTEGDSEHINTHRYAGETHNHTHTFQEYTQHDLRLNNTNSPLHSHTRQLSLTHINTELLDKATVALWDWGPLCVTECEYK